jgi:hypothetical protein
MRTACALQRLLWWHRFPDLRSFAMSVLTLAWRLHLDAARLMPRPRVRVFGGDTIAESARFTSALYPGASLLTAIRPGLRAGLPSGNANRKMLRCTVYHWLENRPELYGNL